MSESFEELLAGHPGFTLETASEELRNWNFPEEVIGQCLEGLRKAGVPEASSPEAASG